jgi:hypothetical protein
VLALVISVCLHALFWGGYKLNQRYHLLARLHLPAWMQQIAKAILPKPKEPKPLVNPEPPLMFVDVSPSQATSEAPKDTPFYSNKNAKAANAEAEKDTDIPQITGKQEQMIKTEDVPRNKFDKLMPAVTAPPGEPLEESKAKAALIPGDLALAKPAEIPKPDTGTAEKSRPRTIKEAMMRNQTSQRPGEKMRLQGGVANHQLEASFDTKATAFGVYDAALIAAVQQRWYDLLNEKGYQNYQPGKVVVQFVLNYDGRITDMKVIENTVTETLSLLCQKSVLDPAPFDKWHRDMRMMIGKDFREIKFTFYYN